MSLRAIGEAGDGGGHTYHHSTSVGSCHGTFQSINNHGQKEKREKYEAGRGWNNKKTAETSEIDLAVPQLLN